MSRSPYSVDVSVLAACGIAALIALTLDLQSPVAQTLGRGERLWGLLIGSDYEDNARHSDTLMVVSYEPQTRFMDVLSIPRDTMVSIPELPYVRRINEVFTYEFRHSGKNFAISLLALKGVVETMLVVRHRAERSRCPISSRSTTPVFAR